MQVHLLSTLSTQCTQPSVRDVCVYEGASMSLCGCVGIHTIMCVCVYKGICFFMKDIGFCVCVFYVNM